VNHPDLWRRLVAEFVGTALLVTAVVGSGIMATTLSPDDIGLQLLENSVATAFALGALILTFGPVSGAHFNPVVSAADWFLGRRHGTGLTATDLGAYTSIWRHSAAMPMHGSCRAASPSPSSSTPSSMRAWSPGCCR
jgi:hypothetical protein